MKKFLIIIFILSFTLVGCSNNNPQNDNKESTDYNTSKTAANEINNQNNITNTEPKVKESVETEISSFSTKIYTPNDEARQNNITLTCSKLNGTIVKSRRNFFFLRYSRKSHS